MPAEYLTLNAQELHSIKFCILWVWALFNPLYPGPAEYLTLYAQELQGI